MEIPPFVGLLSVALLVLANGFFVATEFAFVAVRRTRLDQLAAEGSRSALVAQQVAGHLDAYIAACQLGITMASLALGWIGEPVLARMFEPLLARYAGGLSGAASHAVAFGVSFSLITALHIVVGELAPKGIALQKPEATALMVARPLRLFYRMFRWPIGILNGIGNGALRLLGFSDTSGHEMVHTAEELRMLVYASHEAGTVEASEARIASRAFQFADRTAGELMTPRTEVKAISEDLSRADVIRAAEAAGHNRMPVYRGSLDDVVGILHVRKLLAHASGDGPFELHRLLRPARAVPVSRGADDVLEDMRQSGDVLALVIDEYGSTAGVITLHDLMEGLVGPIREYGKVPDVGPKQADGSQVFAGLVRIAELEEVTGLRIDEEDQEHADTLNGLFMLRLGRLPVVGDAIEVGNRRIVAETVARQRLLTARLEPERLGPRPER